MEMGGENSSAQSPREAYCQGKYSSQVNNLFYVLRWTHISRVYKLFLCSQWSEGGYEAH